MMINALFALFIMLLLFVAFVLLVVIWIWMIVDCARRDFDGTSEKVAWLLVIILVGLLGALIYYFAVKNRDDDY